MVLWGVSARVDHLVKKTLSVHCTPVVLLQMVASETYLQLHIGLSTHVQQYIAVVMFWFR